MREPGCNSGVQSRCIARVGGSGASKVGGDCCIRRRETPVVASRCSPAAGQPSPAVGSQMVRFASLRRSSRPAQPKNREFLRPAPRYPYFHKRASGTIFATLPEPNLYKHANGCLPRVGLTGPGLREPPLSNPGDAPPTLTNAPWPGVRRTTTPTQTLVFPPSLFPPTSAACLTTGRDQS